MMRRRSNVYAPPPPPPPQPSDWEVLQAACSSQSATSLSTGASSPPIPAIRIRVKHSHGHHDLPQFPSHISQGFTRGTEDLLQGPGEGSSAYLDTAGVKDGSGWSSRKIPPGAKRCWRAAVQPRAERALRNPRRQPPMSTASPSWVIHQLTQDAFFIFSFIPISSFIGWVFSRVSELDAAVKGLEGVGEGGTRAHRPSHGTAYQARRVRRPTAKRKRARRNTDEEVAEVMQQQKRGGAGAEDDDGMGDIRRLLTINGGRHSSGRIKNSNRNSSD
ncbi:hypothetical protein HPP92_002160 [Vanilla planifolia]|uniref:Uncharacterized protein n=1 Tax=Vanilla planifolia TaxID=51239 RepID=A0A835VM87_VANPL|nr:hypothetical protein HPP92_002160 [Vanilla planifolia]